MQYFETSQHTDTASPRIYLMAHFPGVHFDLAYSGGGFEIVVPAGVDWADYEERPDLEISQPDDGEGNPVPPLLQPQPPIRHPRDPWAWYQQEYGIEAAQPTPEEVLAWTPPPPEIPEQPVTDVNSPIKAILTGYQESEAARAQRIALLKSSASYALGAKIGAELAAANPPSNAEELAALKAEAKGQASALGGAFFDSYFSWIGAYREGGGPGFLAAVQADTSTAFLDWPTPPNGITLPDGTIVLAEGGVVRDLFTHFLS